MIRFLWNLFFSVIAAAVGLWVTSWILGSEDFDMNLSGFLVALAIFVVAQAILTPFIGKMTSKYATALQSLAALVSTFLALLLANIFSDGLTISTANGWLLGTLLVWLICAFAGWLLPLIFLRNRIKERRED